MRKFSISVANGLKCAGVDFMANFGSCQSIIN